MTVTQGSVDGVGDVLGVVEALALGVTLVPGVWAPLGVEPLLPHAASAREAAATAATNVRRPRRCPAELV
ncbi:MAG TPA: hypothetical protein VEV13_07425 [Candidatus Limnocylindria bacterium]|nr:hypothetical protein [Candidatus Limnocylindria bacterium]